MHSAVQERIVNTEHLANLFLDACMCCSPLCGSDLSASALMQERIVNTEHLVNLDLDAKRNALVRAGRHVRANGHCSVW